MVYACVRYCAVEFSLRIDHSQCGINHYFTCENEFDALYRNDYGDEEITQISYQQDRICLTSDRSLLKRNIVRRGYCLRSLDSLQQVKEVLRRFDLLSRVKPFQRCAHCNGLLEDVDKS